MIAARGVLLRLGKRAGVGCKGGPECINDKEVKGANVLLAEGKQAVTHLTSSEGVLA